MLNEISKAITENPLSVDFHGRRHYCGTYEGRIYRVVVDQKDCELYKLLFEDSEFMLRLFEAGLVKTRLLGSDSEGRLVLEHERIKFQTMFHEWTWNQRKEAAITTLRIQEILNEKNCYLTDPHVFNVAFSATRAVYFDFGSIAPGSYPITECLRNFWLSQTLIASWMNSLHISYPELQDLLNHSCLENVPAQIAFIQSLPSSARESEWSRYDKGDFDADNRATWKDKHLAVEGLVGAINPTPATALDVGANTGDFCRTLLKCGVADVCGLDIDEGAADCLHMASKEKALAITAAVGSPFDLFGYHVIDFDASSWNRLYQSHIRLAADLVICVAVIHHLCYYRNLSFAHVARVLSRYAKKHLIIEWISYSDKHLEGPTNRHGVDKRWFTEDNFVAAFKKHFPGPHIVTGSTPPHRKMFLFSKEEA